MTTQRDPETILAAWLDEGPTDLPDATRRAILTALPTTSQARRGLFAPRSYFEMNTYTRLAAVALVAVVAVGGALYLFGQGPGAGGQGGSPTASPVTPSPTVAPNSPTPTVDTTSWVPFTSAFYGFSVRHPAGWTVTPGSGHWSLTNQPDAATDILADPTGPMLVCCHVPNFMGYEAPVPAGMTPQAFIAAYAPVVNASACYPPPSAIVQATVDGHPAEIAYGGCVSQYFFAEATVVIGNRVWFFDLHGPDRSLILSFLSTVTIDPTKVVD
jgi:hypothetical protein